MWQLRCIISFCTIICFSRPSPAQVDSIDSLNQTLINWHNLDQEQDGVLGTSVERVYSELISTSSPRQKMVVAVIDSGVDIDHEDLKGKIWINADEIPKNGIDDDQNGYVDDIHGWNYIGNKNGENVELENYEYTRIYRQYYSRFENRETDQITREELSEYEKFVESKKLYEVNLEKHRKEKEGISLFEKIFRMAKEIIERDTGRSPETIQDLESIKTKSKQTNEAVDFLVEQYEMGLNEEKLDEYKSHNSDCLDKHLNLEFNARIIIGDDPYNIEDVGYGNNNVIGPRSDHGTSVSGIIAANRDNGVGINGIAESVELMILRTVPDGDEYDKDVALAIRYAVNNGANIINMSFGKELSPNKEFVDEAIKYAASKNVLMVHAAGNSATNVDKSVRFPNDQCMDGEMVKPWINVGASTAEWNLQLVAEFSNYGARTVDLFAPGKDIASLEPRNKYGISDGTSLSCPIVSGIAALVWSHYPTLTAIELKQILISSVTSIRKGKVFVPDLDADKRHKVKFHLLSQSGGVINAYNAMIYAQKFIANQGVASSK